MKWFKKPEIKLTVGDEKIVTRFLFWPLCINGEWRWLETASYRLKVEYWTGQCTVEKLWTRMEWVQTERKETP